MLVATAGRPPRAGPAVIEPTPNVWPQRGRRILGTALARAGQAVVGRRRAHVGIACRDAGTCGPEHSGQYPTTRRDRKSTRLNSSHVAISYAVFCLKKKMKKVFI